VVKPDRSGARPIKPGKSPRIANMELRVARVQAVLAAATDWSMFDRYNIIDERDLARAVAKRFHGKETADTPPAGRTADQLA